MMPMQPYGYPVAPSGVFPAQFQPLLPPTASSNLKRLRPSDLSGGTIAFNGAFAAKLSVVALSLLKLIIRSCSPTNACQDPLRPS
jgi:hypothetical protein